MLRGARSAALILIALAALVKPASATVTFSLVWTATTGGGVPGYSVISAMYGDVLTLSILMATDQTLAFHGVSINFDTDLRDELNLFTPNAGKEWAGTSFGTTAMSGAYQPLTPGVGHPIIESTASVGGRISTYESGKAYLGAYLPVGVYMVGTARFVANAVRFDPDGPDVFVGLFNVGVDEVFDNTLGAIGTTSAVIYGTASVSYSIVPEPGTASLVGLGLLAVVLARRRNLL